nr:hypothetical protein [Mycoplasmopsis bovis]
MAKQLMINEWKYLVLKNTKNIDLGNSLKNVFWMIMMKIKNVEHIYDDQWKRLVNKYKRYNLGMNIRINRVEDRLKKAKWLRHGQLKVQNSNDEIVR